MMLNYLNISLYLHDETVSLNDLLFIKEIGKGNYGSVSLVMNKKTKFPYAIKAICKNLIIIDIIISKLISLIFSSKSFSSIILPIKI